MPEEYRFEQSLKSPETDELINTYVLRPCAGLLVRAVYHTAITPNQLTIASLCAGIAAALLYADGAVSSIAWAGLCITLKDLLDSADGQLARAKGLYSRIGRFLDSIGDVIVNILVFSALGWTLSRSGPLWYGLLAFAGLMGITLRVSYHVFYQTSALHLDGRYEQNRILEDVTDADKSGPRTELLLQRIFVILYGWQDRLMLRIDGWCRRDLAGPKDQHWYGDTTGLRLSGFLGFGTEYFLLTLCSLFNRIELYLFLNLLLMNGILFTSILYRRWILFPRIISLSGTSEAGDSA